MAQTKVELSTQSKNAGALDAFSGQAGFISPGANITQAKVSYPVNSTAEARSLFTAWSFASAIYMPQVVDGSNTWEGVCSVSGTTVTRTSGQLFVADMAGRILLLNGSDACGVIVSVNVGAQTMVITNSLSPASGVQFDVLGYTVHAYMWPSRANDPISSRFEFWYNGFMVGGNPMFDLTITSQYDANNSVGRSLNLAVTNTSNPLTGSTKLVQLKTTSAGASRVLLGRDSDVTDDLSSPIQMYAPAIKIIGTGATPVVSINGMQVYNGVGSPAGVLSAPVGSVYVNISGGVGTTLYVKESGTGTAGWAAK